jgi:hypothetical protein
MTESSCLYALLHYFGLGDGIRVTPVNDELILMAAYDCRYSNVYLLKEVGFAPSLKDEEAEEYT